MSPNNPDPYYNRPEVSNSDLTSLMYEISGHQLPDMTDVFAFGNLVDAMITEPDRIDWYRKLMDNQPVKEWDKAMKMYRSFMSDDSCKNIIKRSETQKVSIANRSFNYEGLEFNLDCRCKWDFFGHISGDIKTTAATNQKQFETACNYFDYPRSRAWYMDIEGRDKDLIIGISKVNYKIFFLPIVRDSELYLKGKQEYTELAFRWWMLK